MRSPEVVEFESSIFVEPHLDSQGVGTENELVGTVSSSLLMIDQDNAMHYYERIYDHTNESFLEDDSHEKEIRTELLSKNKKIINIIQFDNHFDSIIIENKLEDKYDNLNDFINNLDIDKDFFN